MLESDSLSLSDQLFLEITQRKFTHFRRLFQAGKKIKCLSLENRKLTAVSLSLLGEALQGISLETLDLSNTELDDDTIKDFSRQKLSKTRISFINFSYNSITEEGAALFLAYARNSTITGISFNFNSITREGILTLSPLLRNSPLRTLDLSGNDLRDEGALRFIKALKGSPIRKAILGANELTDAGISDLIEFLPQTALLSLDVSKNKDVTSEMLTILKNALHSNQIVSMRKVSMRNGYELWLACQKAAKKQTWNAVVKKAKTPEDKQFLQGMGILKGLPSELQIKIIGMVEPFYSLKVDASYTRLFEQRKENVKMIAPNLTSIEKSKPQKNHYKSRTRP